MTDRNDGWRYALLAAGTLVAGLAGYVGYVLYPRFGLPSVAGASVLALAAAAGFAAFFSPCSFPLLATLLAREAAGDQGSRTSRPGRALLFATSLSVGAVVFVVGVGLLFAAGGRGLAGAVTFTSTSGRIIRAVVGVLLVVMGLVQSGRLLAGLAGHALTTGGFTAALVAFAVTGLVLVVLLFGAALAVSSAHEEVAERLRAGAPTVKRWGGHVLIVVGVWLLALAAFAGTFARLFPV